MKEKNKVTVKAVNIEEAPKEKKKRKRFDAKKVEIPSKRRWQDMDGDNQGDHNKKSKFNGLGFEFPRLSSLSCWQQDKFLNLQMIINKGGKLSSVDEKVYLQLLSLVQQERAEFTKFSKELCEQEKEVYEKNCSGSGQICDRTQREEEDQSAPVSQVLEARKRCKIECS